MTAPHLEPGQVVAGKYTIRALLGFSGVVATYHATSAQGQEVALKLFDPAIGQRADLMNALERVANETGTLPTDNVLRVLDAGYDLSTSAPFSVTELLSIPSLAKLAENGALSAEVVGNIITGLGVALDTAHSRGLFHHALKPTNVFVGPAPNYQVLVTDFGASVVRSAVPTQEAYTLSAPWWAPEQMQPGAQLGAQTDVFSAALIAFYALTANSFWRSCQTSPPDVQAWQQEVVGPRVTASARAQELGRNLNAAMDPIFAQALAADPSERAPSVGEFARAFANLGAGAQDQSAPKTLALPEFSPDSPVGAEGVQPSPTPPPAGAGGVQEPVVGAEAPTPGLPPYLDAAPKRSKSNLLPIILGIVGAVVIGGGAVALLFWAPWSSETKVAETVEPDSSSTETATTDQPEPETSTSSTEVATADTTDAGGDAASEVEKDKKVAVKITCDPSCDRIVVDGQEVADFESGMELLPGTHVVHLYKKGHITLKKVIKIELGTPFEKEYKMVVIPRGKQPRKCGPFFKCD